MAATEGLLVASCREWELVMAGDRSVVEADAERLLGYRPGTLRAQRTEGTCRIPRRQIGNRWRYRLCDIAAFIETGYDSS
ncbi:hypothetical protein D3C80_1147850 [compost metagenome]